MEGEMGDEGGKVDWNIELAAGARATGAPRACSVRVAPRESSGDP